MARTSNIGLNLTTDMSTEFETWKNSIDGNGSGSSLSNMQIIDKAFGDQASVNGTATLLASSWTSASPSSLTLSVTGLSDNDMMFVQGATMADQDLMDEAQLYATSTAGSVTFYAKIKPTSNIGIKYFISRGEI